MPSSSPTTYADHAESTRLRLTFLALLILSLFILLLARLWYLQVMAGHEFVELAEGNAVRTVTLDAPRGIITDRNGEPLVVNEYIYVVGVQPTELGEDEDAVVADLASLLGMTAEEVWEEIETSRVSPLRPRPVATDVPEDIVLYLWENGSTRYPGVYAELVPLRAYPQRQTAAHVLGYLGEISEADLEAELFEDYRSGDVIGAAGIERSYEATLRGTDGLRRFEIDPAGEIIRQIDEVQPTPGDDVVLTLDLGVQRATEQALMRGIEVARQTPDERDIDDFLRAHGGAAVVLEVETGEVVAIASYPTFDPVQFVGGVSEAYFADITDPENRFPLLNRAIQSSFPPGSVWKIVTAATALERGYASAGSRLPCPAAWEWNEQVYRNWEEEDAGDLTMAESLKQSCNTVYYELARRIWNDEEAAEFDREILSETASQWGFGEPSGIDLPSERGGVVPGREWKRNFWEQARDSYCAQAATADADTYAEAVYTELCSELGAVWRGGDAVNMSTGQGDVQTTPLQIAHAYATLANEGVRVRPRLGLATVDADGETREVPTEVIDDLDFSDTTVREIVNGLVGVTQPGGTAVSVFGDFGPPIAAKTGTAEFGQNRQPYAWFAGYNLEEVDGRRYAVAVVVEEGGSGGETAAPIARRIFEVLLGTDITPIELGEVTD